MLIVAEHVTQHVNDKLELAPALASFDSLPEAVGKVSKLVADNGYFSTNNIKACANNGVEAFLAPGRQPHHPDVLERFSEPPALASAADPVTAMRHTLRTKAGRATYALRKQVVEPVFGIIKEVMGFRRFHLQSLALVQGEWSLVCLAFNLKRLHILMNKEKEKGPMDKAKGTSLFQTIFGISIRPFFSSFFQSDTLTDMKIINCPTGS